LAALVDFLDPVRKAPLLRLYVASDPLRHGFALDHVGFLVALAASAAALASIAFERLDLAP
jgi:hypothetical protein